MPPFPTSGAEGIDLEAFWNENRYQAYQGVSVPAFPNLFTIFGPYGYNAASYFTLIENQMRHITRLLRRGPQARRDRVEVTREANDRYMRDDARRGAAPGPGARELRPANSYYFDAHGDVAVPAEPDARGALAIVALRPRRLSLHQRVRRRRGSPRRGSPPVRAEAVTGPPRLPTLPSRRPEPRGEVRRAALLSALEELVRERPLADIGISEIAGAAGLKRSAFYFYFPSKEAAATELLHGVHDKMFTDARAWLEGSGDPRDSLAAAVGGAVTHWRAHRHLFLAVLDARDRDPAVRRSGTTGSTCSSSRSPTRFSPSATWAGRLPARRPASSSASCSA